MTQIDTKGEVDPKPSKKLTRIFLMTPYVRVHCQQLQKVKASSYLVTKPQNNASFQGCHTKI
jgi:hypothetical protein